MSKISQKCPLGLWVTPKDLKNIPTFSYVISNMPTKFLDVEFIYVFNGPRSINWTLYRQFEFNSIAANMLSNCDALG